jgi:nicotinamidase-related amidase
MSTLPNKPALLLIDVQKGFNDPCWGVRNNPHLENNILLLLSSWRKAGMPVIHVKHMSTEPESPLRPGQIGNEFKDEVTPHENERIFEKTVNSAFIGTELEKHLLVNQLNTLVIAGISTDHCVSTTTRMSGNLGFNTYVVADACATFNRTTYDGTNLSADHVHIAALASLHNEFAQVVTTKDVVDGLANAAVQVNAARKSPSSKATGLKRS